MDKKTYLSITNDIRKHNLMQSAVRDKRRKVSLIDKYTLIRDTC